MKKIFIFLLFFIFVIFQNLYPKTLVVDDDYNLLTHNTCEGICIPFIDYCYNNIQDAVDNAGNNDTIKICKGTYNEEVRINKNINKLTITNGQDAHIPDDIKINSNNTGIFIGYGWKNVRNLSINNISITSKDAAIYFLQGRNITLNNINIVSSNNYGFFSSYDAEGNFNFKDIVIKSKKSGIYINDGKKLSFDTITIKVDSSNQYGIFTNWDVTNNNSSFKNINIKFINGAGIIIRECKNTNFDNISITNTGSNSNSHGILIDWDASGTNYFKNLSINVSGIGLNIRSGRPHIENSEIISKKNTAVFFNWDTSNVSITNSKLISNSSSASNYALLIQNSNNNAIINNNCFYHPDFAPYKLAKADEAGNNFDGNFWEGHSGGVYQDGNVVDHSPLSSCPFGGGGGSNLIVDYHMDECFWNGTSGEVKDNSSNGYNATAQNSANTVSNGKICRAGDFTNTNYIKPVTNIPLSTNYTITLWIKFPLSSVGHKTYWEGWGGRYQYYNIADRPTSDNDFIYFKKNIYNGRWYWCVDGNTGIPVCRNFNMSYFGWHLVTFVASGDRVKMYIDKQYKDTILRKPTGVLSIIGASDFQNDLDGQTIGAIIDEFKIFNQPLTLSQIQQIYDNENSGKNYDGSNRVCPICGLIANYQMDECLWNGTNGEVKDNTTNHYNATAMNGANTVDNNSVNGMICEVGHFDGIDDYIEVPNQVTNVLKGTASLSFWIKTNQTGNNIDWRAPGITGVEQHGGTDDIFWGWIDASGHIGISKGDNYNNSKSVTPINDNQWHHIVLTRNATNGQIKIYIDGNLDKVGVTDSGVVGTSFSSIGRIENTNPSRPLKYFHGYIDELKVFNIVLTSVMVSNIYNNERNRKNWDGSDRSCNSCNTCDLDHFEVSPQGGNNAIACEDKEICFYAKASDNSTLTCYTGTVTISSKKSSNSSYKGTWKSGTTDDPQGAFSPGNPVNYTFVDSDNGSICLNLENKHLDTDPEILTISIEDTSNAVSSSVNITFYKAGFKFVSFNDANHDNIVDNINDEHDNISNQLSCKPSNTGNNDTIIYLKTIKTNDQSGACESILNGTNTIQMKITYLNPPTNPHTSTNMLSIDNGANFDIGNTWTNKSLNFINGKAELNLIYKDAGEIKLDARYDLDGNTSNGYELISINSPEITFKPFGFYVYSTDSNWQGNNCNDTNYFKKAGENFNLTVKAKCWHEGNDANENGINDDGDDLSDDTLNPVTPNYTDNTAFSTSIIDPSGGGNGSLSPHNSDNFTNGIWHDNVSYSEVGVVKIIAEKNDYYGAGKIIGNNNFGRFIPDHFRLTPNTEGILNNSCVTFTYTGQTITGYSTIPSFTVTAENANNNTTQNYRNNCFKLNLSSFSITSPTEDDIQNGTDGTTKLGLTIDRNVATLTPHNNGTATYFFGNDNITYTRDNNSKIAPFYPQFHFTVTSISDYDSVSCINCPYDNITVRGSLEMRYGRIKVIDNYGPETDNLTLNIYTEYWDGQKWMVNGDDSCTSISASDFKLDNYTDNLNIGETSIENVNGITNGTGSLILTAPGDNNSGSVTIYLDSNSIFYLYLNDNETPGIATFGIYRGRDRIILWQEVPSNE